MKTLLTFIILSMLSTPYTQADKPTEESKTILAVEMLQKATVKVNVFSKESAGFYVSPTEIMTAYHTVRELKTVMITKANGANCFTDVVKVNKELDMALLKQTGYCGDGVPLKLAQKATKGQSAIKMGFPTFGDYFVTKGIVSGFADGLVYTDAYTSEGDSGGALVNSDGEVLGMMKFKFKESSIGGAVDTRDLRKFIGGN